MPTVERGSAELAFSARGSGPAVLLLHAGVNDRRSWAPLIAHLGEGFRTIAYDRRGYGETRYEPEPHDPVADALAVLDADDVARALVVGASMGGGLAIDLALAHPERVDGLVLIAASPSGAPPPEPSMFDARVQALWRAYEAAEEGEDIDELNRVEAHAWLDGWSAPEGRVQGPPRELFLEMNAIALSSPDPGPEEERPPAWDRVTTIEAPTLVLCGDLDVVCHAASDHLVRSIPGARAERLEGTGHLPHLEGHDRCLEAVVAFLRASSGAGRP
jgi:pimeloyl-ACP methyl ester carboxylesterase